MIQPAGCLVQPNLMRGKNCSLDKYGGIVQNTMTFNNKRPAMRIAPVLATMLFGLFCSGALALDDTPTHAPYLQAKGEDGRAAIRPAGAGAGAIAAIGAGKAI
jgi:hypothetical protein